MKYQTDLADPIKTNVLAIFSHTMTKGLSRF
jgi:hypothetical protein